MQTSDYINLVSSIASGVLAVVALALSIVFFVLAKRDAERSAKSADQLGSRVERLEKLFDTLYSDTFSMMRETYTDMRKHVWRADPSSETMPSADTATAEQTAEILARVSEVSAQVGVTGEELRALQDRLQPVLRETLAAENSRREEFPDNRSRVLRYASFRHRRGRTFTLEVLAKALSIPEDELVDVVFQLGREGILEWNGAPVSLSGGQEIRFVPRESRDRITNVDALFGLDQTDDGPAAKPQA